MRFFVSKYVQIDLMVAERAYYGLRRHCPDHRQDDITHIQKAILDAGGFSSEMEEVIDIVEARLALGDKE